MNFGQHSLSWKMLPGLTAFTVLVLLLSITTCPGKAQNKDKRPSPVDPVMSDGYRNFWNPGVQEKIERNIDKNRKADAELRLVNVKPGSEVRVTQISHDFLFGEISFFLAISVPQKRTGGMRTHSVPCSMLPQSRFTGKHWNLKLVSQGMQKGAPMNTVVRLLIRWWKAAEKREST